MTEVGLMTDLAHYIQQTPLMDTHEHLHKERDYVENGPDVLQHLFMDKYITADLVVAGATPEQVHRLLDSSDPDLAARFSGIRAAWDSCQHTGYGEAVRLIAQHIYEMNDITPETLEHAGERNTKLRQPGERLRILKEIGNLDHVQVDDFCWQVCPDDSGLDFFLYDISWWKFCCGVIEPEAIYSETGVEVTGLSSLQRAMEALFDKYAAFAIAVKSQHAYDRALLWQERPAFAAERVLTRHLSGRPLIESERNCLGDWCWARGTELAIDYNLPFKLHTGYYADYGQMPVERIRSGHLCELLQKYPSGRFIIMHAAYPNCDELLALAKHYPNVYIDLCWAWSVNPYAMRDLVRHAIHTVPINKVFAFGGDTFWPGASAAFAIQARQWLTRALQAEIEDGYLSEAEAMVVAERLMRTNQQQCFDLAGTRAAIRAAASR